MRLEFSASTTPGVTIAVQGGSSELRFGGRSGPCYVAWMTPRSLLALAAASIGIAIGCGDRGASTVERLEAAIAAHADGASEPSDEEIATLFARLDADVAAARADAAEAEGEAKVGAEARARELETRRQELMQAYLQAKVGRLGEAAADTVRDVSRKVGEGLEDAGRRIRESMEHE